MFECAGCLHLAQGYETVDEVRTAKSVTFTNSGPKIHDKERKWAQEMVDLVGSLAGKRNATLGLERMNANVVITLEELGLNIVDAQYVIEISRTIKSPDEVKCIVPSLRATEAAVGELRDAVSPGLTENQLWSVMHKSVIEQNEDYIKTRLLSAGPRTNPWFRGSAGYVIQKNDLAVLDTDVVNHNMSILRPGLTFREYADCAWDIPVQCWANRYFVSAHGCGLTGECPYLYDRGDFSDAGYDGVIEPGMVFCVESYIGEEGGTLGVKLEQQVLITGTAVHILAKFLFEDSMLQ
ncbi:peptidase yqhT [Fusarium subglutinans]|uniref:Peptidase yqhT n=1 Tax=Gibberella subglutinans TaxID=42677 RepID=A0A8H5UZL9_GIBSU|nr:peptidase yqhT [Fusarium subglutinans]KAF5603004.1 peptidase yqhT [Fusarium subglutinans]